MKRFSLLILSCAVAACAFAQTSYDELARRAVTAMEDDSLLVAEDLFKQALKAEPAAPGNAIIWGHLASIAERTGREHEALEQYNIALGLAPQLPALLLGRASLFMKLGNEPRALTDYNEVLTIFPTMAIGMAHGIFQRAGAVVDGVDEVMGEEKGDAAVDG